MAGRENAVTTKRPKSRARCARPTERQPLEVTPDETPRLLLWLGLAWLVGFSLFYYSFTLPNDPNHIGRFEILYSLPQLLPFSAIGSARWSNLLQRADLIGVALLIWVGAWGLGELVLRAMRLEIERVSLERTYFAMALGLCAVGLLTLGLGLAGLLNRWIFIGVFAAAVVSRVRAAIWPFVRSRRHYAGDEPSRALACPSAGVQTGGSFV